MKIDWTFRLNEPWKIDRVLEFVRIANLHTCNIYIGSNEKMLNAKGLLGIVSFSLSLNEYSSVLLQLEGEDAQEAFEQLAVFLQINEQRLHTGYAMNM
ncbi:HPr family phosphocarrier protein [Paenibacillus aestuarii]|uniref:HPr family phosphocarrier protein n=1 Tax=Paenibacillus aestuarii TaxID=516965 RepID=A0ABW0KAE1_9BACL|nr:HPr family phosphocarrier protein [Paenibacillus aestuarii]